jgi:hypothetical protein
MNLIMISLLAVDSDAPEGTYCDWVELDAGEFDSSEVGENDEMGWSESSTLHLTSSFLYTTLTPQLSLL